MTEPYYTDDRVTLYLGDSLTMTGWTWTTCDVLVTDPPYGRGWRQGASRESADRRGTRTSREPNNKHTGITGDGTTAARDKALALWGDRPGIVFGDMLMPAPPGTVQALIYRKPNDAGTKGTHAGYRRDIEAIYLIGPWKAGLNGDTSVLTTGARSTGSTAGMAARYGHPHAKPVDVMCDLIQRCPPGSIADPFAGAGSTLIAARMDGRKAVGVEIDERYCEMAARRLSQQMLDAS
jgi:site-specific DNA-methyltransferase (adenine-specific)